MLEREGHCQGCGYALRGLPSGACPECGKPFDWANPKTYRSDAEPTSTERYAEQEHRQAKRKRTWVFLLLMAVGFGPLFFADFGLDLACCCSMLYPVWLLVSVISLLSLLSTDGSMGLLSAVLVGVVAGIGLGMLLSMIATSVGLVGLVFGAPAGLVGALIFKHLELNHTV